MPPLIQSVAYPATRPLALHLVQQAGSNAYARAADGMPESDCAAVDVQTLRIEAEVSVAGYDLRGKRFVQLDQINVVRASSVDARASFARRAQGRCP